MGLCSSSFNVEVAGSGAGSRGFPRLFLAHNSTATARLTTRTHFSRAEQRLTGTQLEVASPPSPRLRRCSMCLLTRCCLLLRRHSAAGSSNLCWPLCCCGLWAAGTLCYLLTTAALDCCCRELRDSRLPSPFGCLSRPQTTLSPAVRR